LIFRVEIDRIKSLSYIFEIGSNKKPMPADKNPVFRKAVIPWYDSTTAHIAVALFMALVILFAAAGLAVARDNPDYHGYIWVPVLLLAMSVMIIAATVIRLIKRYTQKPVR
jgi:hypothetical protein